MAEIRTFRMHKQLLFDVIQRQAGSLAKAILEGIMNCVDAGATTCTVSLDADRLTIADDGRGFRGREEIESFFEVFGQPHTADEGKTYGTFRMGRGQMFAFGVNRWRTGKFRMDVDIKGTGLDYALATMKEDRPGCRIEVSLYDPLLPSQVQENFDLIARWAKYAPIPVEFNGKVVSRDPALEKWDHALEDAYVRVTQGASLAIYNLGIHVFDLPKYRIGCGGEVVSRKQLKVNFARNDVQSDCPIWKAVKKVVDVEAVAKSVRNPALDEDTRRHLATQMRAGKLAAGAASKLKIFTAVTGRHYTLKDVLQQATFASAPLGFRPGDRVHQSKVAFVLAWDTLERFGFADSDVAGLLAWLASYSGRSWWKPDAVDLAKLTEGIADTLEVVAEADQTLDERVWASLARLGLSGLSGDVDEAYWQGHAPKYREIRIGSSDRTSMGWTDGERYIAVDRGFLADRRLNINGLVDLGLLLCHELCHHGSDVPSHGHDHAFYEEFHERCDRVGRFVEKCLAELPKAMERAGKKMTKTALRSLDRQARAANVVAKVSPPPAP